MRYYMDFTKNVYEFISDLFTRKGLQKNKDKKTNQKPTIKRKPKANLEVVQSEGGHYRKMQNRSNLNTQQGYGEFNAWFRSY